MITFSVILFLIVLLVSWFIFLFCKRVIYKLNKRVLARNMALVKNGPYMAKFDELSEAEIREKLIFPFFMVLGYNTYDMREFQSYINRAAFYPDYVVKKWDSSKLCKRALSIKYIPFKDNAVDFDKKIFDDSAAGCKLDELMDKLYFKSDYYVITNGYLYVFFNKKRRTGSKNFEFCFNLKIYSKKDAAQLAFYSKQYLFLEISDVYRP